MGLGLVTPLRNGGLQMSAGSWCTVAVEGMHGMIPPDPFPLDEANQSVRHVRSGNRPAMGAASGNCLIPQPSR